MQADVVMNVEECLQGGLLLEIKRELLDGEISAMSGGNISRDQIVDLQQQVIRDAG